MAAVTPTTPATMAVVTPATVTAPVVPSVELVVKCHLFSPFSFSMRRVTTASGTRRDNHDTTGQLTAVKRSTTLSQ
jgi:hypothetical protein